MDGTPMGVLLCYPIQYTGHKMIFPFIARVKLRHYFCLNFSHYHIAADINNVLKYGQDKVHLQSYANENIHPWTSKWELDK